MFYPLLRRWATKQWSFLATLVAAILLAVPGTPAIAGQLTLSWDAVANATGYKIFYGQSTASYTSSLSVGNVTTYTVPSLADGTTYYFAVTATNGTTESSYSNQVSAVVPGSAAPAASFAATPITGVAPLAVTLADTSTGSITSRSWNLGDGTTSSSQTVYKSYSTPGTYNVTLTVSGSGGSSTASKSITVSAAPPTASFSATPVSGTSPLTVAFNDTSSGSVTSWAWQFGDGGTSTSRSPAYTYATAGTYSVTLTVTGPGGSNKLTKSGLIAVSAPASGGTSTTTPPTSAPVSGGLVAAFGFEEQRGTTVYDASGNGNHGTVSGARRLTSTPFGRALRFDGVDDWVTINDNPSLSLATGMTLQAWVYPTAAMKGWATALVKELSGQPVYSLYANGDGQRPASIVTTGGAERILSSGGTLPTNAWTHLASTYDGANQMLYVNGVLVGSRPQAGSISISGGKLRIAGNSVWGEYFAGYIDEVRVYNRALSQAEIAADANRPVVALQLSIAANRSDPLPLNGQSVSGNVYIFYSHIGPTAATNPVKQVKFWLNDSSPASPKGTPRLIESVAPFDFAGTATDGKAMPLNVGGLTKGVHTVSAQAILSDGTVLPVRVGTFRIP